MEKFGLFDLLAALAGGRQEEEPARQEPPAPEQNGEGQEGIFTAGERRRRAQEALLRHEQISRRIDRRKR